MYQTNCKNCGAPLKYDNSKIIKCEYCGTEYHKDIYGKIGKLVWVLSSCICEECFNEWQTRNKVYEEDLALQEEYAESYYKNYLGKEIEFDE